MADLAYRSNSTGGDSSFTTATISATVPTGTAAGDGMIIVYDSAFLAGGGAPTHTTPSGWTAMGTGTYNNGVLEGRKTFYSLVAGTIQAETLTSSGNAAHVYCRLSYQNPDPTTFASTVVELFGLLASTSSPVFPTITTNGDRQLILYTIGATLVGGITYTPASSGLTERSDANTLGVYELQATTIAAQGTKTISSSSADQFFYGIAVFNPAHTASGALASASSTIAGSAAHTLLHTSTGALASQAATIAGTAAHQHATTGALASQAATVAGTATHLTLHTSTGALAAQAATIAGEATNGVHATSGALAAAAATIAGTAAHLTLHTTTGALAAASATIAGAAAHQHAATGALASQEATVAGTAVHLTLHTSTGALAAQAATIAGDAAHEGANHPTSGAMAAQDATIAGASAHLTLHTTTGALSSDAATMSGVAARSTTHATTGAMQAQSATLDGLAQNGEQILIVDTHDGEPKRQKDYKKRQEARRQALLEAIGPPMPAVAKVERPPTPATVRIPDSPVAKTAESVLRSDNSAEEADDEAQIMALLSQAEDQVIGDFLDELSRRVRSVRAKGVRGG